MRANLKAKIETMVEKLGPEVFSDFDKSRVIKRPISGEVALEGSGKKQTLEKKDSFILETMVDGKPISYYHEIELNNVFQTLNVTYQDISEYMEGLQEELNF